MNRNLITKNGLQKKSIGLAIGAAALGLGLSMPSCPGQQAMQKQVDLLQSNQTALNSKINKLSGEIQGLKNDVNMHKQIIDAMGRTIEAQRNALDNLEKSFRAQQARALPSSIKGSKKSAKKRGRR